MSRIIACLVAACLLSAPVTAAEKPIDTPEQAAKREKLMEKLKQLDIGLQKIPIPPPPSSARSLPSVDSGQSSTERRALENLDRQESLRINERILERLQ